MTGRTVAVIGVLSTLTIAVGTLSPAEAYTGLGIGLTIDQKDPVILGELSQVPVTITAPETKDTADRPLRLSVNVGAFGDVERTGPGTYRATYFPPETRFPQVALVAVWRETGPDAPIDFLRIPLSGRTKLPVKSKPGAEIRVAVGDQTFGPVVADRQGKAQLTIAVPPGVFEVVATSSKAKDLSQGTVPVDVPPYNRLTLAVTPYLVPADGESAVTVHVFYDTEGTPPPIDRIKVTADRAELKPAGADQNRYRFRFAPRRGTQASKIELRATVLGDKVSHAEATLSIGLPIPERVVSRGLNAPLFADGKSRAELSVLVSDRLGLGVPGLTLTATSASKVGIERVAEVGQGEYTIALVGPPAYPAGGKVAIDVEHARAPKPPLRAHIELGVAAGPWPVRAAIDLDPSIPIADGRADFRVRIRAFDAAGNPYSGGQLELGAASDAEVSKVEDVGRGEYQARVLPARGAEALDLSLADRSGHLRTSWRAALRAPPSILTIAPIAGIAYHPHLVPTGGLLVALRPALFANRRLEIYLSATYRQVSSDVTVGELPTITAELRLLPISLGATYDVLAGRAFRTYLGLGAEVVPYSYQMDSRAQASSVARGVAPGVEAFLGAAYAGVFGQLELTYASVAPHGLSNPGPGGLLILGYRFGVL